MTEQKKSWRDVLKVHPACELFPLMGADELRALGEDIKANGLRNPITLWCPQKGYGYCSGSKHYVIDGPLLLLDGRNRLDAMDLVGIPVAIPQYSKKDIDKIAAGYSDKALKTFKKDNPAWAEQEIMDFVGPASAGKLQLYKDARVFDYKNIHHNILFEKITPAPEHKVPKNYDVGDPYAYVASTNIHRRHLVNPREMTETLLKANPERSDRETAKLAGTSHPTVAAVRKELETTGKVLPVDKRTGADGKARKAPVKTAKAPTNSQPKQPVTLSPAMVEQAPLAVKPNAPVVLTLAQRRLMALIALEDDLAKIEARYESVPEFQGVLNLIHSARMIAKKLRHQPPPPSSTDNMNFRVIEGDQQQ